jgi:hypothetical protein
VITSKSATTSAPALIKNGVGLSESR